MQILRRLLFVALLPLSLAATAHGYWIEVEGNNKAEGPVSVKLYFGDYAAGERLSGKTLDKMKDIKVYVTTPDNQQEEVTMIQGEKYWEGSFTATKKGTYIITGINDEREVQDWTKHQRGITRPIQYLKAIYQAGKGGANPATTLFLDVHPADKKPGNSQLYVQKNGQAAAAQEITIAPFDGAEQFVTTDDNGMAKANFSRPGQYIVSVEWIDATPGEFKGKKHETVRHRLDYTLVSP